MSDTRSIVRWFAWTWLVLALPLAVLLLVSDKLTLHAAVNAQHTAWADAFFRHFTHFADGWVPTAIALLLLFISKVRSFLMVGLSCGLSAIIVQLLKHTVFSDMDRPFMFKDRLGDMDWVEGIEQYQHFSFPSGHSTAAFSMCMALAVVVGRTKLAAPFALLAALLAFSRIYLSQHFAQDALAGSTLGTLTALGVYWFLYQGPLSRKDWPQRKAFRRTGLEPISRADGGVQVERGSGQ